MLGIRLRLVSSLSDLPYSGRRTCLQPPVIIGLFGNYEPSYPRSDSMVGVEVRAIAGEKIVASASISNLRPRPQFPYTRSTV